MNEELNLSWVVNYLVLCDSILDSFRFFFRFVVGVWIDKAFVTYIVAFVILTDVICNAEIKFLRFYSFPTPHTKQGSPWFLRERDNVSIISRDAWNDQIFLRDSILVRGIGDPVSSCDGSVSFLPFFLPKYRMNGMISINLMDKCKLRPRPHEDDCKRKLFLCV